MKASATAQNFTILTESETSVAFCRQLKPSEFRDPDAAADHMTHQNYMVVDAGGTYDIRVVLSMFNVYIYIDIDKYNKCK